VLRDAQLRDAHRTLTSPGLLSGRCPGVQAQFDKLFFWDPDEHEALPAEPPMPDDDADPDPYRHDIGTIMVKQREGPEKEEPTLPWVMKHLKPLKAAGPYGDRYEHYKVMPQGLVHDLAQMALSGRLSEGARFQWQCGVLHAGDKQRRTAEGYTAARPIVVGSALRRIVGRIPCAQLKFEFAKIFAEVWALGSAIPAGIEIAYRTVTLATDAMIELADDAEDLPVPLQTDFSDGFNNARRAHMLRTCRQHFPSLLRYLYACYDTVGYL